MQPPLISTPTPAVPRIRTRPVGWDVPPKELSLSPSASKTESFILVLSFDRSNAGGDTIMTNSNDHYLDPLAPHNDTDRSGNHYSNGDSCMTPEYEWNGFKKVYRTKKPYRGPAARPNFLPEVQSDSSGPPDDNDEGHVMEADSAGGGCLANTINSSQSMVSARLHSHWRARTSSRSYRPQHWT